MAQFTSHFSIKFADVLLFRVPLPYHMLSQWATRLHTRVPDYDLPGRLGIRTGSSYNKKGMKSGSLQSALSMEMENPEAERIRREFEMYRMNKENEIANIQKSEKRALAENKRLRAELQALQVSTTQ